MSILLSEKEQFRARIDAIAKCDKPTDENIFTCELEAQARKVVQYLEEPCTEHPYFPYRLQGDCADYHDHRYDCPDCMKQVHEELNIQ